MWECVFFIVVWGCGTGLPNLDQSLSLVGVPSKTFDFVFLINDLRVCVGVRVFNARLDIIGDCFIMDVPVE